MIDVAVILNPASGSPAGDATPERIVELFAGHGRTATILATSPGRSIGDQARSAAEQGCRLAVASGGDGTVNASDLLMIINSWGPCPKGSCPADITADGAVNAGDLLAVINGWGTCP